MDVSGFIRESVAEKKKKIWMRKSLSDSGSTKNYVKSLDGLRGIAILFVLLSHSSNAEIYLHSSLDFSRIGKIGVNLFFVLSAYLLDKQILQALKAGKANIGYWKRYTLRRVFRIYPLFLFALSFHYIFYITGFKTVIESPQEIITHLFLVEGKSIFWSIPVEFKYYIISPIVIFLIYRYFNLHLFKIIALFGILAFISITTEFLFKLPEISTFRYIPIFLTGTLIAILEIEKKNELNALIKWIDYSALLSIFIILITIPSFFEFIFDLKIKFHAPLFYLPFSLLWGIILISATKGDRLKKILEFKLLRFIGKISFSLYLLHMPVIKLMQKFNDSINQTVDIYFFFIVTFALSSVTYLFVERPCSKRIYN